MDNNNQEEAKKSRPRSRNPKGEFKGGLEAFEPTAIEREVGEKTIGKTIGTEVDAISENKYAPKPKVERPKFTGVKTIYH